MQNLLGFMNNKKFLIFDYEKSKVIHHNGNFRHIGDVQQLAIEHGVTNLWILPNSNLAAKFEMLSFITDASENFSNCNVEQIHGYYNVWKKSGTYEERTSVHITIPHLTNFAVLDISAKSFCKAVVALWKVLKNVQPMCAPAYTGKRELEDMYSKFPNRLANNPDDLIPILKYRQAGELHWKTKTIKKAGLYVHAYDRNGSYCASMQGLKLGLGVPNHYEKGTIIFDKKLVGLWRVKANNKHSIFTGEYAPMPFFPVPDFEQEGIWLWTPSINAALRCGYEIEIEEAYIWEHSRPILEEWAKFLYDGRFELREILEDEDALAQALIWIKAIPNLTIGSFAPNDETIHSAIKRYDFRSMVIAENYNRVMLPIEKLAKIGEYPIIVYVDGIFLLSDNPNPYEAYPMLSGDKTKLGGYRYEASMKWEDFKEAFETLPLTDCISFFNENCYEYEDMQPQTVYIH